MSDGCCGDGLDAGALEQRHRRVLLWVLAINILTFFIMVVGSVVSGSSSLLSGTLDNLGDALTYALSLAVVGASTSTKARVAFLKGMLILSAAILVAIQIAWRLYDLETPIFESMGIAAALNLVANLVCLSLLYPVRGDDLNMESMWECSRNDIWDGLAVIAASIAVWLFDSGWPDLLIAIVLLAVFLRSATRVLRRARQELQRAPVPG
ncbi:MAG: cation transporter [Pseudomonadales bacterium]|nr:cation transporter [Pseudomonadales bacterium]